MSNLDNMIGNQMFREEFLNQVLSLEEIDNLQQEKSIQESSVLLECDEEGNFPDDYEDDEIDRKLGV